jgi:hypothetical protein
LEFQENGIHQQRRSERAHQPALPGRVEVVAV